MPSTVAIHIAITAATLQSLPHTTVSATDEKGHTDQYGGVSLRDLLTQQSVPAGTTFTAPSGSEKLPPSPSRMHHHHETQRP